MHGWTDLDAKTLISIAGALVSVCAVLWTKLPRGRLAIAMKRTNQLYLLASTGRWRNVHPMALQIAGQHAFGRSLDDREIRYALNRHDSLGILNARIKAAHLVRWDAESGRYTDNRSVTKISHRFWKVLFGLGVIAAAFISVTALVAGLKRDPLISVVIAAAYIVLAVASGTSLVRMEAAETLLDAKRFPLLEPTDQPQKPSVRGGLKASLP